MKMNEVALSGVLKAPQLKRKILINNRIVDVFNFVLRTERAPGDRKFFFFNVTVYGDLASVYYEKFKEDDECYVLGYLYQSYDRESSKGKALSRININAKMMGHTEYR